MRRCCTRPGGGTVSRGPDVEAAAAAGTDNAAAAADTTDVDGVAAAAAAAVDGSFISMVVGSGDTRAAVAFFSLVAIARWPRRVKAACLAAAGVVEKVLQAAAASARRLSPAAGLGGIAAADVEDEAAPGTRAIDAAAAASRGRGRDAPRAAADAGGRARDAAARVAASRARDTAAAAVNGRDGGAVAAAASLAAAGTRPGHKYRFQFRVRYT